MNDAEGGAPTPPFFHSRDMTGANRLMQRISIAIDGPAGAGKSTVAKEVARRMQILYVDTGAMYRTVAWLALQHGVPLNDEDALLRLLAKHDVRLSRSGEGTMQIEVDGLKVSDELRSPEVSSAVSLVSVHPAVRQLLTEWQRDLSRQTSVVMDGRDIGTVVLPNANAKIFLTASLEERARRRAQEFMDRGDHVDLAHLTGEIAARDERDGSRQTAPMRPADDAHLIDSTGKIIDDIVDEILALVEWGGH